MKQKSFETMLNRLIGLTPDQVESLAQRKGYSLPDMERWLTPILND